MNAVETRRRHKSFNLSIPFWHWSSLVVTVCNMGYLPKYEWSHFGSLSISIITPLLLVGMNVHHNLLAGVLLVIGSCLLAWGALIHIHTHGVPDDHDASAVVIDEVAGSGLAALAIPFMLHLMGASHLHDALLCALFVGWVFRLFDLWKPYPADVMDTLWHHPFSVMADDLVAGLYAGLVGIGFATLLGML